MKTGTHSIMLYIIIPVILIFFLFSCVNFFFLALPGLEDYIFKVKREMIQELTLTVWTVLDDLEKQVRTGVITREEAMAYAREYIRSYRYGKDGKDYFWINDMSPKMVVHPYLPNLEGKDLSEFKDPTGENIFLKFVHIIKEHGSGNIDYMWQWKDDITKIVPKLSYIKGFKPWDWIIGTGIYIGDVREEIKSFKKRLCVMFIGILSIVIVLSFFLVMQWSRIEKEREEFILELKAKNAELEQFSYVISHDLMSPVISIAACLNFLEEDLNDGDMEDIRSNIDAAKNVVERMSELIEGILKLAKMGRTIDDPKEFSMQDTVQEALHILSSQIAEKGVCVKCCPDLPQAYGDKLRVCEVIQNLVTNAMKYMGEQANPYIEIGCKQEEREDIFYVKDNGAGIKASCQEKIFELFKQIDPEQKGVGVGLPLVKKIVEVHGGRVWVESEFGKGSTFYFTLPNKMSNFRS